MQISSLFGYLALSINAPIILTIAYILNLTLKGHYVLLMLYMTNNTHLCSNNANKSINSTSFV